MDMPLFYTVLAGIMAGTVILHAIMTWYDNHLR